MEDKLLHNLLRCMYSFRGAFGSKVEVARLNFGYDLVVRSLRLMANYTINNTERLSDIVTRGFPYRILSVMRDASLSPLNPVAP